jgi:hypothetical protein
VLTPTLKNETIKVSRLVAEYRAGRIVIPEFQRDYVWPKSKAPKLIDSLYRNFPVSTLLFWQSSDSPRARRSSPKPRGGRTMNWLIDGQQRVMTLARVMSGDEGRLTDRSGLLALYVACLNRGIKDFFTGQKVLLHDEIDRHHILPRRQFAEAVRSRADTVANVAFVTSDVNRAISFTGPEVYLAEIDKKILMSQCIPQESRLWRIKLAESFFAARRTLLAQSFNEFVTNALSGRRL